MQVTLAPGKYIVAVSGGVDSVVLLDMLHKMPKLELVVAHYDHGIRDDSLHDRLLVQRLAKDYDLPFIYERAELGPNASEAIARQARYTFLQKVKKQLNAAQIVTAHHQDDLIETAILNMLRGTGRKGLTSLAISSTINRPLLGIQKQELIKYAVSQHLVWHEDNTNNDPKYKRNYVRQVIIPRLKQPDRQALLRILEDLKYINLQLDTLLINYLHNQSVAQTIDREPFKRLPAMVAQELIATWLREQGIRDFDKKAIHRLAHGAKTKQTGTQLDILHGYSLLITRQTLALQSPER